MKAKFTAFLAFAVGFFVTALPAHADIGSDIVAKVQEATNQANPVYVAVLAAIAGFFVFKLIRRAL